MKVKIHPVKPSVIMLYGYPGSGRTTFASQLSREIKYAHIDAERLLKGSIKSSGNLSDKEVASMMTYIANEFIKAGVGVVFDLELPRAADRHRIKLFAKKHKLKHIIIWLQIDAETAQYRATSAKKYTQKSFKEFSARMQNPTDEDVIVISGKHNFRSQKPTVIKKLLQKNIIKSEDLANRIVKPELMSLVPNSVANKQEDRRNISIS